MAAKEDIQAYLARWKIVEEAQMEEQRTASVDLRWRQLNAAYGLARSLGLLARDASKMEVRKKWAFLKNKATKA